MADQFLNKTGLIRLWEKIKAHMENTFFKLTGGTVTGNIDIQQNTDTNATLWMYSNEDADGYRAYGAIYKSANSSADNGVRITDVLRSSDGKDNRLTFVLKRNSALSNAVLFTWTVNGASTTYRFYGEHNPPAVADVTGLQAALDEKAAEEDVDQLYSAATYGPDEVVTFDGKIDGMPLQSCLAEINAVQEGSGDPSPSNIRPITGWTGAKVTAAGKNLLTDVWYDESYNAYGVTGSKNGDLFVLSGTATAGAEWSIKRYGTDSEFCLPAGTYSLSGALGPATTENTPALAIYKRNDDGTRTYIARSKLTNGATKGTFTLAEKTDHLYMVIAFGSGVTCDGYSFLPMLEVGGSASDFSPYSDEFHPVSWQTEAGTVYGGTVDLVSGALTVTHGYVAFDGTEAWNRSGTDPLFWRALDSFGPAAKGDSGVFSHLPYNVVTTGNTETGARVGVNNGSTRIYLRYAGMPSTVADWQATLAQWYADGTPFQAVYEMATPVTYQLTPQQITALAGDNNVWADTGDVTVEYGGFLRTMWEEIGKLREETAGNGE